MGQRGVRGVASYRGLLRRLAYILCATLCLNSRRVSDRTVTGDASSLGYYYALLAASAQHGESRASDAAPGGGLPNLVVEDDEDDEDEFDYRDSPDDSIPSRHLPPTPNSPGSPAWRAADDGVDVKPTKTPPPVKPPEREEEASHGLWARRLKMLSDSTWVEVVVAALLVIVLVTAYKGRRDNYALAKAWVRAARPVLEEHFSRVGFPDSDVLLRSWSSFEFYATGRRNCRFISMELECGNQQCFWRRYLLGFFVREEAIARIEISTEALDTVVFGVFRKREQKQILKENVDLQKLTKARERRDLHPTLVCSSDTTEAVSFFLKPQLVRALMDNEQYIRFLKISDLSAPQRCSKRPGIVQLELRMPLEKQMEAVLPNILLMLLWIADLAAEFRINEKVRESLLKARKTVTEEDRKEEEEVRNEALEKRRQERRKQEEERFEKATPEQRRKMEEKKYKKQVKASSMKFKIIKA